MIPLSNGAIAPSACRADDSRVVGEETAPPEAELPPFEALLSCSQLPDTSPPRAIAASSVHFGAERIESVGEHFGQDTPSTELDSDAIGDSVDVEDARRADPDLPPDVRPEDFWQHVVHLHEQFSQDPQAHPRALESAIVWATLAASAAATPGVTASRTSGVGQTRSDAERSKIEERAVEALVVAWQQRDSALASVGRRRG